MKEKRFYNRPMGGWDRQEEVVNPSDRDIIKFFEDLNGNQYDMFSMKNIIFPKGKIMMAISPTCGTMITNFIPEKVAVDSTIILGNISFDTGASLIREMINVSAVLNHGEYKELSGKAKTWFSFMGHQSRCPDREPHIPHVEGKYKTPGGSGEKFCPGIAGNGIEIDVQGKEPGNPTRYAKLWGYYREG